MDAKKTIVIGLDGAHFEILERWLNSGELPNIGRAIEEGVTGDLQSVLPPVTSPNWKSYATGKNPGKLGIYWWENVDMGERKVYYPDSRKNKHQEFWEIIGEKSSAGVVNVPTTYPVRKVEPFIIAGAPDSDSSGFTHPPELEEELQRELEYKVTKNNSLVNNPSEAADEIVNLIDLRFKAGKYLLDQYDPEFLQITTFYLNSLHHYFWDSEDTLRGWKIIDQHIGDLLDNDYNIVFMSDHGSTEIDTVFHINTWLEQEGYLTPDMGMSRILGRLGITAERLIDISTKLRVRDFATSAAPEWITNKIPSKEGDVRRSNKTANLNWEETVALASGQGPIYIDNNQCRYEETRSELIEMLSELTDHTGNPVAENVYRGEEIYDGPYLNEAPDIVVDQREGVHIAGGLGRDQVFTRPEEDGWKGENKRNGLFIATGPDFTTGSVNNLSVLDLAPTLLHLHGCAIPHDLDGEVIKELYAKGTTQSKRQVRRSSMSAESASGNQTTEADDDVRGRLQDLGYLE